MELGDVIGLAGVPLIAALVHVAKAWVGEERCFPCWPWPWAWP